MTTGITRDLSTGRFWTTLATHILSAIGGAAIILGIVDVLWPDAVSRKGLVVSLFTLTVAVAYGVARSWPRPVQQHYTKPNTEIRLVEGDLFKQGEECLVIGMTTTFDTEVPHIIQAEGVQGQFLAKVFHHDRASLDAQLERALQGVSPVGMIQKPGKQVKYPIGTVAVLKQNRRHFFCLAYSEMDESNVAHSKADWVWSSLASLWHHVRTNTNGDPVAIPVIGGGLSRVSHILPAQDAIRFIALSFMMSSRDKKVCDRLDIVIRKEDVKHLDMPELQAFLTSLQES